VPVKTMNKTADFKFMEEPDSFSALEMQYKGDELSMLVLLPAKADGLADLEKSLTAEKIALWSSKLEKQRVAVALPRFTMTWGTKELSPVLKSLGMTEAFEPGVANFSGMTADPRGMYIALVFHKAFVDVNEEGTEAAAATAVVMKPGAMIPPKAKVFTANHPFVFMIRHNMTGNILFMGRVNDPR
jgi:serpin B